MCHFDHTENFLQDDWLHDLDSDIAGTIKDTLRIEPKTQLSSTERPVCGEKEEIEERFTFDRDTLDQEKHDEVMDPTSTWRPAGGQHVNTKHPEP